ncbi:thiazole biosynthesis adenylyltransferase ThiF [Bacillus sp. 165]|uniref:thiazole biosynthesis adenylyltransferase ThiF n=1 Tax=Bacillus sp. 165 TaxID=1529117 RepID=UPI001ADAEC60|nr:thiazole biosynthesis adenylyltransferase ThiF [Bacillus sp. 165]MBO9129177.1 thiazole biosynthesis adenylyltransferase ThiF [Bacillus sp. 165]
MQDRYSRQILFHPIGEAGQKRMANKHVLILGAGALGTASAEALVRAGVGKVTIVDRDYVEWSNLQRQQLYTEEDARDRMPKALAAKKYLSNINSEVDVVAFIKDVTVQELEELIKGVHLIMDATDNFDTRMIINDMCQKYKVPWIYGACVGSYGITFTIIPDQTPCLHCLLKHVPMGNTTCDTAGIISPAVNMVVSYQTAEALKLLVEDYEALRGTLVSFDLWKNQHASVKVTKVKKDSCPSCGEHRTYPYLSFENQTKTEVLCGRNTVQIRPSKPMELTLEELALQLGRKGMMEQNPYLLSLKMDEYRMVIFQDGRVFVHGTNDIQEAKRLYYQIVG